MKISPIKSTFFPAPYQIENKEPVLIDFQNAIDQKIIAHKTLAYFMARSYLFLLYIGVKNELLRFRQHLDNEKAHYAKDCWDIELFVNGGWLECVGLADRQSFDLTQHAKATKGKNEELNPLYVVQEPLAEVQKSETIRVAPVMKEISKKFQKETSAIGTALNQLPQDVCETVYKNSLQAKALIENSSF